MVDRYLEFSHTSFGRALSSMMGLPQPPRLRRDTSGWSDQPLVSRAVSVGATHGADLLPVLLRCLHDSGATVRVRADVGGIETLKKAANEASVALTNQPAPGEGEKSAALVFDASGARLPSDLRVLFDFVQPLVSQLAPGGRVVVIGRLPAHVENADAAATAAALRGFVRSLGKEIGRKGSTVNLLEVDPAADAALPGALRFLLSDHSSYISGQCLQLDAKGDMPAVWTASLTGKVAVVTGAARGIGAAISEVLAREGAQVIGIDRPQEEQSLAETMGAIGGQTLAADITDAAAPELIASELMSRFGGADIIVHNAGITRDKTLRNMPPHWWDQVLDVNFGAIIRLNEKLLNGVLRDAGRMVCISSIGGIGGNAGQTNYGATKAGLIGYVAALAPKFAEHGGAINAIAPGFIETQMTAAMPMIPREVGRRLCSLGQGGKPLDIAEAVAFMASPYAGGVNGKVLRVCGQNWFGQ